MTIKEKIGVKNANIDSKTGEVLSHSEIYTRAIEALGGLDAVIPYIPFNLPTIQKAIETDQYLNNLPMEKWDWVSGFSCTRGECYFIGDGIWRLYRKAGINSASCSDGVCVLKEAARQWSERENKKNKEE